MELNSEENASGQHPVDESVPVNLMNQEDHDHHEQEDSIHYRLLSKDQLIAEYFQLSESEDILSVRSRIAAVEEAFRYLLDHEKQAHELSEAADEEETTFKTGKKTDPLTERFYEIRKIIQKKKNEHIAALEKQKEANLTVKRELLDRLKDIIQNEENMQQAFHAFHEIQEKWRSTGIVPFSEAEHIQRTYRHLTDKFYEFIRINRELQELDWKKNLEIKIRICEEAESLIFEPSIRTALDKLAMLQIRWQETGPVPREKRTETVERFKAAADAVYQRRQEHLEQLKKQWAENEKRKTELIEQVEKTEIPVNAGFNDWKKITESIMAIQESWKHTGRAEKQKNDELWNRFRAACDVIFKKRKEFFAQRRKEFQANLQKKNDICSRAEALLQSADLKSAAIEMRKLTEEWKQTGYVPGKMADKVWMRFRKAKDAFYESRKSFFEETEKELENNFNRKTELIERIEKYELSGNRNEDFKTLMAFQHEWSDIGMVPADKKNAVYERYKKAIDSLFDRLRISEKERSLIRFKDRIDHLKTSADGKAKMREEERVLHSKINHLSNEVNTLENNIGFFSKSKNADQIRKEFEEKISKAKSELAKLREQLQLIRNAKS